MPYLDAAVWLHRGEAQILVLWQHCIGFTGGSGKKTTENNTTSVRVVDQF
jgi:hypothetical protein